MNAERPCPRLVAVSDEARLARTDAIDRIAALAEAGCPAILLRSGTMSGRALYELAARALGPCHAAGAELWIGERLDVALAAGVDGVQLPARGLSIQGARRAAGARLRIGRSVHTADEAARAASQGADHVILGTIFATLSHSGVEPGGPTLIAAARSSIAKAGRDVPILAIGGIESALAAAVVAAGAWGVAAVTALWDAPDPSAAVRAFRAALDG